MTKHLGDVSDRQHRLSTEAKYKLTSYRRRKIVEASYDQCNLAAVAGLLGMTKQAFWRRRDLRDLHLYHRARGQRDIQHCQMVKAVKTKDTGMLIWMGKVYLEQKEASRNVNVAHTFELLPPLVSRKVGELGAGKVLALPMPKGEEYEVLDVDGSEVEDTVCV
jgi:hypothetical protein